MGSYYVKEQQTDGYRKSLEFEEIQKGLLDGEINEDFLIIKAGGRSFYEMGFEDKWVKIKTYFENINSELYFIKEHNAGKLLHQFTFSELQNKLSNGTIKDEYIATKVNGREYNELNRDLSVKWITIKNLIANMYLQDKKIESPEQNYGAIQALKFFAVLDLICGIIAALYFFGNSDYKSGVIIGIAILLQGAFMCALFLVIAGIGEDLKAIRSSNANK